MPQGHRRHKKENADFKPWQTGRPDKAALATSLNAVPRNEPSPDRSASRARVSVLRLRGAASVDLSGVKKYQHVLAESLAVRRSAASTWRPLPNFAGKAAGKRMRKGDLYVKLKTDEGTIAILARKAVRTPRVDSPFEKLSNVITEYYESRPSAPSADIP